MRIARLAVAFFTVLALSGCAHMVSVSPDINKVQGAPGAAPIGKHVGYYIPADKRQLVVTTPGGGGDKVSYKPYADIETAFYKMLTTTFGNVTQLSTADDPSAIAKSGVNFVLRPTLATNSSSSSMLTWPPTEFSVDLECTIADATGNPVATLIANGKGKAEFSEFKSDFGLAGRRAMEDALLKMQAQLRELQAFRK